MKKEITAIAEILNCSNNVNFFVLPFLGLNPNSKK
jgi:hypothetical protein